MCTELLPPGGYPIAVKYIIYRISNSECNTATVDRQQITTPVNKPTCCTAFLSKFKIYICQSLHVSGCYGTIIRRYNCVDDCLVCRVDPAYQTVIHTE